MLDSNTPPNGDKFGQVIWLVAVLAPPLINALVSIFNNTVKRKEKSHADMGQPTD